VPLHSKHLVTLEATCYLLNGLEVFGRRSDMHPGNLFFKMLMMGNEIFS